MKRFLTTEANRLFAGLLLSAAALAICCGCRKGANQSGPTRTYPAQTAELAKLEFADPLIERRFEWFVKFAESAAKPDWHHRPYQTFAGRRQPTVYHSERASFANQNGRSPLNYHGPLECRVLNGSAFFDPPQAKLITGVGIYCRWKPANGWGATVEYRTFNGRPAPHGKPNEAFVLRFMHYPTQVHPDLNRVMFSIDRSGNADYQTSLVVDKLVYEIKVDTWDHMRDINLKAVQPDETIRRVMATPETFRDYCISIFERLAAKIETSFAAGKAISAARQMRMPNYGEDPDSLYVEQPLTAEQKAQCLQKARADAQARLQVMREHYLEIYAAANKALPLLELLRDS